MRFWVLNEVTKNDQNYTNTEHFEHYKKGEKSKKVKEFHILENCPDNRRITGLVRLDMK